MGVLGDTVDEFKHAKPAEKVFIVGGAVAVLAIALYIHNKSSTSSAQPSQVGNAQGPSSGGIQTVPGPNSSTLPILPSGLCPVTDSQGQVIAYQPCPQSQTGTPKPPPSKSPCPGGVPPLANGRCAGVFYKCTKPGDPSCGTITGTGSTYGSTFYGPTGVAHYVTPGGLTLDQIAKSLGLSGWNSLYAIPQNQAMFGKMNAKTAAQYKPTAGATIVIPGGTTVAPTQASGLVTSRPNNLRTTVKANPRMQTTTATRVYASGINRPSHNSENTSVQHGSIRRNF